MLQSPTLRQQLLYNRLGPPYVLNWSLDAALIDGQAIGDIYSKVLGESWPGRVFVISILDVNGQAIRDISSAQGYRG